MGAVQADMPRVRRRNGRTAWICDLHAMLTGYLLTRRRLFMLALPGWHVRQLRRPYLKHLLGRMRGLRGWQHCYKRLRLPCDIIIVLHLLWRALLADFAWLAALARSAPE